MGRGEQNCGFTCARCGERVRPLTNGSYRNHCPRCLCSVHVDVEPGDRASGCRGLMDACALRRRGGKVQIVHRCRRCGERRANRVAEATEQPDSVEALVRLPAD